MEEENGKNLGQKPSDTGMRYMALPLVYALPPLVLAVTAAYYAPEGKSFSCQFGGFGEGLIVDGVVFAFSNVTYAIRKGLKI